MAFAGDVICFGKLPNKISLCIAAALRMQMQYGPLFTTPVEYALSRTRTRVFYSLALYSTLSYDLHSYVSPSSSSAAATESVVCKVDLATRFCRGRAKRARCHDRRKSHNLEEIFSSLFVPRLKNVRSSLINIIKLRWNKFYQLS